MQALAVLSLVLQSAAVVEPDAPEMAESPAVEAPIAAAAWRFADFDADGLLDAYLLRPREGDCLLRNLGDGEFVDVTSQSGLSGLTGTRLALWRDLDGDGRPDLLVGTSSGELRLFQNLASPGFVEVGARAGLASVGAAPLDGRWVDLDRDALPDLHLVTAEGDRLWRNLGGLVFEPLEPAGLAGRTEGVSPRAQGEMARIEPEISRPATLAATLGGVTATGPHGAAAAASFCAAMLLDQATGQCLVASSLPGLGQLLPLSLDFNVQPSGNVGIGTAAPADKLHVAGVVRTEGGVRFLDGSLQTTAGTKTWNELQSVPPGFADGIDDSTTYQAGSGLALADSTFSIANNGVASTKLATDSASLARVSDNKLAVQADGDLLASANLGIGVADPLHPLHAHSSGSTAVWGETSAVGTSYGVTGVATFSGGSAGGVYGESSAYIGVGVKGAALSTTGATSGVHGVSHSDTGRGVFGQATSTYSGYGVYGLANGAGGYGVWGTSNEGTGVLGKSVNYSGVRGWATGTNAINYGVAGISESSLGYGVRGQSPYVGVEGFAEAASGLNFGVRSSTGSPDGFAGYFVGVAGSANHFQRPVGIATEDPLAELHVAGDSGNADFLLKRNDATHGFNFGVNATPRLYIARSDGSTYSNVIVIDGSTDRVGIGTDTPQFLLHVDGTAGKPGGGSWATASDARLKKNVRDLDGALERMLALRGVTFEYIDPKAVGELEGERIGVIAQEVESVFPDWVDRRGDGYRSVTFRGFEAVAIEALRELRQEKDAEIAALETRLARLEGRLSELEGR